MLRASPRGNEKGAFDMVSSGTYVVKAGAFNRDADSDGSFQVDNENNRLNDLQGSIISHSERSDTSPTKMTKADKSITSPFLKENEKISEDSQEYKSIEEKDFNEKHYDKDEDLKFTS